MKKYNPVLLLIVLSVTVPLLCGQAPLQLKFRHISTESGLSQSTVLCIYQDSKGFMWFGTYGGLNRYDGYDFKPYMPEPDNPQSLSNNVVTAICEEISGSGRFLWVGTESGLNKLDLERETFRQYYSDPKVPGSLSNHRIKALYIGLEGTLWIGTDGGGLNRYDKAADRFVHYRSRPGDNSSISDDHIRCFYQFPGDKGRNLWFGTDKGIKRMDILTGAFHRYNWLTPDPKRAKVTNITTMYGDRAGNLWVGTWKRGLYKFDPKTGNVTPFLNIPGDATSLGDNTVRCIYEDRSGTLWIGTFGGGLDRYEPGGDTFYHYRHNPNDPDSLSKDRLWSIYEDRAGVLWVGTDFGGLNTYDRFKKPFRFYKVETGGSAGLDQNNISAVYESPGSEGKILWIGTMGGGLKKLDRETSRYTHYMHDPIDPHSISNNTVRAFYSDPAHKGRVLWVGTDGGLNKLDIPSGKFTSFQADPDNPKSLSYNNAYSIFRDSRGNFWVGTFYGGLNLFDPTSGTFKHFIKKTGSSHGFNDTIVWCITEDMAGGLWIGTDQGGLNRYDYETGTFRHYMTEPGNPAGISSNKVLTMYEDKNGNLWLGTTNGLNKFNRRDQRFTQYSAKQGFPVNTIHSILADDQGNLWMGTLKGLVKFDPRQEKAKTYNTGDGLQSTEFNVNACFASRSGELLFGGIKGLNTFFPGAIRDNRYIPPVIISGFQVFNRPVTVGQTIGGQVILQKSITYTPEIELLHENNFFTLEFSALHYASPGENRYAYIMEGIDRDWNQVGNRRIATYTNVPPGEYTFRVRGTNSDGIWNMKGATLKITVIPPFYQTWWFYTISALFLLALAVAIRKLSAKFLYLFAFWKKEKYIGQYRLLEKIAGGGMGSVYKAHYLRDKSEVVAIKVLKEELFADTSTKIRFKQEALIIDQLDHPNILKVIERGEHQQRLYIVMEFLKGRTLEQKIKDEKLIAHDQCLEIMIQVASALECMHRQEIIHRDLKTQNIMLVEKECSANFVKILDFGLARTKTQTRLTETGVLVGTVSYMAPEQVSRAEFTSASDIHSLGILLYEMVTGGKPFTGATATDIMQKILLDLPVEPRFHRPDISPDINHLIMNMLEKEPLKRPTAKDVLNELKNLTG